MKKSEITFGKFLCNGLSLLLITGMAACGDGANTVEDTDTMDESTAMETETRDWDNERFNTSFNSSGRFGGWDSNRDNMLDENEYYGSYYNTWDVNKDKSVDQDEWNNANKDFGITDQNWTDWDTNKDNKLDENEFRAGASKKNNFSTWDKNSDRNLDEREYSEGVFSTWDTDRDGRLNNDEYNTRYNRYYGEGAGL